MGNGDDGRSSRGWSMVFEDKTDSGGDHDTDEHPQADHDPKTIIDPRAGAELAEALAEHAAKTGRTVDDLLQNVAVTDVPGDGLDHGPELTVRAPAPVFDLTSTPLSGLVEPLQFVGEETDIPDDDAELEDAPTISPDDAQLENVELTRKAPIPYDLFHEGALPEVSKSKPVITRRKVTSADAAPPPPAPQPTGEETMLDLAAQLGMAPEAKDGSPEVEDGPTADEGIPQRRTMELPASRNDEIDLAPFLDDDTEDGKNKGKKTSKRAPIINQRRRPAEGADAAEIQRWAGNADVAARTIPIVLGVFVVLGTIVAMAMLFSSGDRRQEHVEMRFLSLSKPGRSAARPSDTPSRIAIDTIPEGVFVLYGQELLGKTPLLVDLQIALEERVVVELSGPYFERYVGEVGRDAAGEYRVTVELQKKK